MCVCVLRPQDRSLVDDDSQVAVVRRSFNQFDEEGASLNGLTCFCTCLLVPLVMAVV